MTKKSVIHEYKSDEKIRINKYLSDAGICSRREADRLIEAGKVTVDGKKAEMGMRVLPHQKVCVNGKKAIYEDELVLIAVNKPVGIECTSDKNNPDNIVDFVNYPTRIYTIGRLDKNSDGLILMTNDGNIVNKISKSVNAHEKEYVVKVNKKITDEFITNMSDGVEILGKMTNPCTVIRESNDEFRIILTQGMNRQIRRMCETQGYKVISLTRVRIMNIRLGKLKSGTYRKITHEELDELLRRLKDSVN